MYWQLLKLSIGIYILPFPQRRPYSLELFIWYRNDWFLNKFHSRVKFMLHSHDRIKQLNLRHSGLCGFHSRSDTHAPLALALHNLRRSLFSVYMIPEWHFVPAQGFQSEWKPGMNSFWNDWYRNKILSWYHVNWYKEIYGDGMKSFWNESHSSIM